METQIRQPSGACPGFFRDACREASSGGTRSYRWAGYSLAGAVAQIMIEDGDEVEVLEELGAAVYRSDGRGLRTPPDDDAVLGWFDRNLPKCMDLIPPRRRMAFLDGVYQYALREENDITSH